MEQNPFGILNVYADCSAREMAAGKARLMAFTSVGKAVKALVASAKTETEDITAVQVKAAYNALQRPDCKIRHALFWFFKPEDEELGDLLERGGLPQVIAGFENCYDKLGGNTPKPLWLLQDLTAVCVLSGDCGKGLKYAYEIFPQAREWLKRIGCGTVRMSPQELEVLFMSLLGKSFPEIDQKQLGAYRIERNLNALCGNRMGLRELGDRLLCIERLYLETEAHTEKLRLEQWSDRLAGEAVRIINGNFPFRTTWYAKLFWSKTSDEIKGKAHYAATLLENIEKLFDCSGGVRRKMAKKSKMLDKLDPPVVIATPAVAMGMTIMLLGLTVWFPLRCVLRALSAISGVRTPIGDMDTFLLKCAMNCAMFLTLSLPLWLAPLALLGIIPVGVVIVAFLMLAVQAISILYNEEANDRFHVADGDRD